MGSRIIVARPESACRHQEAEALAHRLGLPLEDPATARADYLLLYTAERLELHRVGSRAPGPIFVDFVGGAAGYRRQRQEGIRQPLARAAGLKAGYRPSVLDATAGLGKDGFVLASLGCRVRLIERCPIIAALLADGLSRAAEAPPTSEIAGRLELATGESLRLLAELTRQEPAEVIYLDPMFPHRTKSALVKKEMRFLRDLVGDDQDAPFLLAAALREARRRVVVKRPRLASTLPGPKPDFAIEGKTSRYDIYLPAPSP